MADKQNNLNNMKDVLNEAGEAVKNLNKGVEELVKNLDKLSVPTKSKDRGKVTLTNKSAEEFMDDLVATKIQEKEQQLDELYDQAIKENKRNKKKLGSKQDFIERNLSGYSDAISSISRGIFDREKTYNIKYGGTFNRNDVYQMATQAANKASYYSDLDTKKELDAANKMVTAGEIIGKAADVFWKAALKLLSSGIERQVSTYDQTYSGFAARTNTNNATYLRQQLNTGNQLLLGDLSDNVGVSEVMQMWSNLAERGMNSEDIFANALDNVVTKKIVPYLDTTSTDINILNNRLNGNFIKDIRGINKANLEIAGNNYATKELLDKIVAQVQPMSDEAIQNLAQGSAELSALINYLTPTIGENAAKEYANMLFKAQNYGGEMLQSGTTYEKLFAISSIPYDINNPLQYNDIVANAGIANSQLLAGLLPGYDSTYSTYLSQIGGKSLGIKDEINRSANILTSKGYNAANLTNLTNIEGKQYQDYLDAANREFEKGEYQTATEKQKNFTENMTSSVATIEEQIGVFGTDIVKGISNILLALVGGKVGAAIAGALGLKVGAGGGGLGSLIASGGGLQLGAAASSLISVAAPAAIGTAVVAGVAGITDNWRKSTDAKNSETWAMENYGEAGANNKLYSDLMGQKRTLDKDSSIITATGSAFERLWYSTLGGVFDKKNASTHKLAADMNITTVSSRGSGKPADTDNSIDNWLAYYIAMDRGGRLSETGYTREQIIESLNLRKYKTHDDLVKFLSTTLPRIEGYLPISEAGNRITKEAVMNDAWLKDHYFRQGLGRVPYDDFPALLHEGEAILTASTTNSLNELVQEYKNNKNSTAELDVIIQNQTNQLIEKMNEIISTISISANNTGVINESQRRIRNSMTSLTSTLAFQN